MKFPRCVVERISMKYDRNLGAFGTKERNEIWAEVERNSGLRQPRRAPVTSRVHKPHDCKREGLPQEETLLPKRESLRHAVSGALP